MPARQHHHLSQFYLRGFTDGGSKNSKLTVIDIRARKCFSTIPRNIGGERDFNRIQIPDLDCNALETALADFEGCASRALRRLDEWGVLEGDDRDTLLSLIALQAIRSPARRKHWEAFEAELLERTMGLSLATKQGWEALVAAAREDGEDLSEVPYEEVKAFFDSKQYDIEIAREHHIALEFSAVDAILPYLHKRNWLVVRANARTGPLITSDNPVVLTWNHPEQVPPLHRDSPGFGMRDVNAGRKLQFSGG